MVDLDFDLDLRRRQFHTGVQRNIIALCVVIWRVRGIVRIRTEERGTVHFRLREQAPLRRLDFAKGTGRGSTAVWIGTSEPLRSPDFGDDARQRALDAIRGVLTSGPDDRRDSRSVVRGACELVPKLRVTTPTDASILAFPGSLVPRRLALLRERGATGALPAGAETEITTVQIPQYGNAWDYTADRAGLVITFSRSLVPRIDRQSATAGSRTKVLSVIAMYSTQHTMGTHRHRMMLRKTFMTRCATQDERERVTRCGGDGYGAGALALNALGADFLMSRISSRVFQLLNLCFIARLIVSPSIPPWWRWKSFRELSTFAGGTRPSNCCPTQHRAASTSSMALATPHPLLIDPLSAGADLFSAKLDDAASQNILRWAFLRSSPRR